jgi:DNA-binding NtrC family response regulator
MYDNPTTSLNVRLAPLVGKAIIPMSVNPAIIVLDDDRQSLQQISVLVKPRFEVIATSNEQRAVAQLQNDQSVFLFLISQAIRGTNWMQVLQTVRGHRPQVRRVLMTPYGDLSEIVPALHNGIIHHVISKPVISGEIAAILNIKSVA